MDTDTDQMVVTPSATVIGGAVLVALAALFLAILALGRSMAGGPAAPAVDGDVGAADTAAQVVDVALTEFAIGDGDIAVAEGGTLRVSNDGSAEHDLTFRDADVATATLQAGQSEDLSLAGLAPGVYEVFCTIPGHEGAGMVGTVSIGGSAEAAATDGDPGAALEGMARAEWLRANYEASVGAFPAETEAFGAEVWEGELQPDGSKLFDITIDEVQWEVSPGNFVDAIAYNGQVPGPTIKVDVGDTVTFRLNNALDDMPSSLHPHGIFMHPVEADGVGLISHDPIMPGDSYEVTFTTSEISVGMYHPHDAGLEQIVDGAFGAILVGQMPLPAEADNVVAEEVMVLNDAGHIGLTLNGKSFPATEPYVLQKGEQMIMHYYNEGLMEHPMHLHNNAQLVIAKDGYPLAQPYFVDTLNVAPGERYTVVIFAEVPGIWVWHCHILSHVEKTDGSVFGMFTALIVEDSGDAELDADTGRTAGDGRNAPPGRTDDLYEDAPPTVGTGA